MDAIAFSRQQMIEQQLRAWEVFNPRVLCAFDELPREEFVPAAFRAVAFADMEIPLGSGAHMMAPKVEGRMLDALAPQPTDRALEIGTGSGWITALLATLCTDVFSYDIVPEFISATRQKLHAAGIVNANVERRDASEFDGEGGFDVIAVTASMPVYDDRYARLLNPGGRLFVVCGTAPVMTARLVVRGVDGFATSDLFETVLEPLVGLPQPSRFTL